MSERDIFTAAREIIDPAARSAYLDRACGGDPGLRSRVVALLRAHDQPNSLLDHPAVAAADVDNGATQALTGTPPPGVAVAQTTGGANGASDDEALSFLSPSQRPDSLGRLGHYEVLQVLGRGGFGIVFRAFDEMLQRVVALKVMAPQLAATSPARKRFLREARSSAQVRHENVVQVYEVAEQPLPYLAMEFIPGETLQQWLDRVGPLDVPQVLRIGRQIAEGLAAAHVTDLIHRDIKPANVLIEGGQHKVKITDFGLARAADDASISQSGIIAGTPMYMAPEQAKGETLDQRADMFSLGSVLYQMVAGRPPFRANSAVAALKRVAEDRPRAIREIIPETPQWLCDIIAKLHAKDPDKRYQSAREVADVLADCEAQLKANHKLKDYSRIPRSKPRRSGRRKWGAAMAAAVLLSVIALVVLEFAGVTHLFRWGPQKKDTEQPKPAANASFDASEAQEASAKQWGVPVETVNSIGMKLRFIPPGKFMMGSSKEETDFWLKLKQDGWYKELLLSEGPQHEVEITQPFYVGRTDVTVGQFRQFVKATGYKTQAKREGGAVRGLPNGGFKGVANTDWLNPGFAQTDDHPVVCVSWNDAVEFCQWLSKQEGKTYRLPTEAEWEYSCRAGSKGRWSFGDDEGELWDYARVGGNSQGHTWPVAGLKANAWGLYDMHGNVEQYCQDLFDPNYYRTSPPKDPPGPAAGNERVSRGGFWLWNDAWWSRSAMRHKHNPADRANFWGFRVVLVVSPPAGVRSESGPKPRPAGSPPAAVMPPGAVLVMNFEKDTFFEKDGKTWVRDLSGRGNDGVCEGVAFTPGGKVGGGLACQGGALRIPHSLTLGQANYTITGWCRRDEAARGDPYCLYLSGVSERKEPFFMVAVPEERSIFVNAWNKDYDPPNYWLGAHTKVGSVPDQGWYFFAVTMRDGGVGRGTLRVTVNETTYPVNTQMVKANDGMSVCDLVGNGSSGTVIDELASISIRMN